MSNPLQFNQSEFINHLLTQHYCQDFNTILLQQYSAESGKDAMVTAIDRQLINAETLARAAAEFVEGIYVENTYDIRVAPSIINIDKSRALRYRVLPVQYKGTEFGYLLTNIFNLMTMGFISDLEESSSALGQFAICVCSEQTFDQLVGQNGATFGTQEIKSRDEIEISLEHLIITAKQQRASDIRIFRYGDTGRVTFRIDGDLCAGPQYDINTLSRLFEIIEDPKYTRVTDTNKEVPRAGKMEINFTGEPDELRVNFLPSKNGMDVNMRFMMQENFVLSALGATPAREAQLQTMLNRDRGMILLTGATGSGKSSTAYALLNIAKETSTICAAEDPVEHSMEGVAQINITPEIGYESAIASFLRHDPDIIFIGEIRTPSVASAAFLAARTGHLLLSSVHASSATGTLNRLRDLGVTNVDIGDNITFIVSQRLVKRVCPHCSFDVEVSQEELLAALGLQKGNKYVTKENYKLKDSTGCSMCDNRGTHGRCLVSEVLYMSATVKEMVLHNEAATDIQIDRYGQELSPFEETLIAHLDAGEIRLQEAKVCMTEG